MPNVNKFPSSKLKLDEFFLNWLSSQDSQKLVRPRPPGSRGPSVFAHPPAAVARARPRPVSSIHRNAAFALTQRSRLRERPRRVAGAGLAGGRQGGPTPARPVPAERGGGGCVAAVAVVHAGAAAGLLVARHAPPVPPERHGDERAGRARLAHVALARAPPRDAAQAAHAAERRGTEPVEGGARRRRLRRRRGTPSPRSPGSTAAPRRRRGPRPRARRSCSSRHACSAARRGRWTSSSSAPWRARCASSPASSRRC
jgi:hypothetical protein